MLTLVAGLALFIGAHLIPTMPGTRTALRDRLGTNGYMAVFSLVSIAGLIVLGQGWKQMGAGWNPQIWYPPVWSQHLAALLMLPALILIVATYVPSRIRTVVKHPMLTSMKLWSLAHLLAVGHLAGMVLFGSILAYSVYDRISIKRRAAGQGLGPLGTQTGGIAGDLTAVGIGVGLYAILVLWGHQYLFGVAPIASLAR